MAVETYDIYNAKVPYRNSQDIRPVIIINVLENKVTIALISGAIDLRQGSNIHFKLNPKVSGFQTTGLKKECYVAGDQIFTIDQKYRVSSASALGIRI